MKSNNYNYNLVIKVIKWMKSQMKLVLIYMKKYIR